MKQIHQLHTRVWLLYILIIFSNCSNPKRECNTVHLDNNEYRNKLGLPILTHFTKPESGQKPWKIIFINSIDSVKQNYLYSVSYSCKAAIEYYTYVLNYTDTLKLGFAHEQQEVLADVTLNKNDCYKQNLTLEELNFITKQHPEILFPKAALLAENNSQSTATLLATKIDVNEIKSQIGDVTQTFLSKNRIQYYQDKGTNYYFSDYTLIDRNDYHNAFLGSLVEFDSINPSKYDKDTSEFIEITLLKKGIKLYNKIEVGCSIDTILKYFGNKYKTIDSTLIYTNSNTKAFFKIKDSMVTKIKVGIYKKNISEEAILNQYKGIIGKW